MQCPHCHHCFFKTLEVRISNASELLYKKRCKRCKYKHRVRKDLISHAFYPVTIAEWDDAQKVSLNGYRARVFVSEYTQKISRAVERQTAYWHRLQCAGERHHDTSKTAG